jgi:cytoskeletal protein RodZ
MRDLNVAQVDQLRQIGAYLSKERQEQSIPLEEVALKTFIPLRLLQALEQGESERLPETVFVQGFIRRYADILGLDGTALAKTLLSDTQAMIQNELISQSVQKAPLSDSAEASTSFTEVFRDLVRSWYLHRFYKWIALLGLTAIALIGLASLHVFNRPKDASRANKPAIAPTPSVSITPVASPSATASPAIAPKSSPSPSPTESTVAKPTGSPSDTPVQVAVTLTADSWMQIEADGQQVFEGTLKQGEQKTWTAKTTLVVHVGNAGAVQLSHNQGKATVMGATGEVKDATFTSAQKTPEKEINTSPR